MYLVHVMLCCLIYGFSEGRILQAIIGRSFSFSWTFNNIWKDVIQITQNASPFIRVWPANNYVDVRAEDDRVKVVVETSAEKTVIVTVNYLNITKFDSGIYKVIREYNSEDLNDSVVLETIEVTPYTTMTTPQEDEEKVHYAVTEVSQKRDNEGFKNYMTTALSGKKDGEENQHYTTAVTTAGINAEEFPFKHHLMYIVLGMGAILAAAFFACIMHRTRICLCENRVADTTTCAHSNTVDFDERLAEENPHGNYWTIVSNEKGDMCTAIETEFEPSTEPPLTGQILRPTKSEQSPCIFNVNDNLDEYINPIHARSVELEDYIHPIHTSSMNTNCVTTRHSSEF